MNTKLQAVPDTNVLLSSRLKPSEDSHNVEFFKRWEKQEFDILYSHDTLREYIRKLLRFQIPRPEIIAFVKKLQKAKPVYIEIYHHPSYHYPIDQDDIAFILCADNGNATHLISYDSHLLDVAQYHSFQICPTGEFLEELNKTSIFNREH